MTKTKSAGAIEAPLESPREPALAAGIHDIPEARYHADPCEAPSLSNSLIKRLLNKSPRHAWLAHPRLNPLFEPDHDAGFDFGTAAHSLLLEGVDPCTVVDAADWRTKAAQAAREAARAEGQVPMLAQQHATLLAMVGAARGHLKAAGLGGVIAAGQAEQTMIWQEASVWCRARIDHLADDRTLLLDYKTTKVANPEKFMRGMIDMGYDTQAAFYTRGIRKLGLGPAWFVFLVQETEPPFCCYLVELAESMRHLAGLRVERGINLWSMCMSSGTWPAYPREVYAAEAPPWELSKLGLQADADFHPDADADADADAGAGAGAGAQA